MNETKSETPRRRAEARLVGYLDELREDPPTPGTALMPFGPAQRSLAARGTSAISTAVGRIVSAVGTGVPHARGEGSGRDDQSRERRSSRAGDTLGDFLPQLAGALVLLLVGLLLARLAVVGVRRGLRAAGVDDLAERWRSERNARARGLAGIAGRSHGRRRSDRRSA